MIATPIPRTLLMTAFGDMDTSKLDEKPQGRLSIDTCVMPISKIDSVATALKRVFYSGSQAYWICPLVEESDKLDFTAVEDRYEYLSRMFGEDKVAMVHDKMKTDEKDKAMKDFTEGKAKNFVATTVIEVGVDVPNSTIMVIEQAERFGLSQLHQLRGRIGRGDKQSSCLLLYDKLIQTANKRLKVMRTTDDGFIIAEEDFKLRGTR